MTPAAIASSYDTSIIVRRWLGCWIDFVTIAAIFLLPDGLLGNQLYQQLLPLWILMAVAYFPVTEGLTGRSLGKWISRTIIVDAHGEKPGIGRAALRTLLRLVEVNPFLMGGIPAGIVAAASKTRQRLGDMAANTYVLKAEHVPLLNANVQAIDASAALAPKQRSGWAVAAGYLGLCSIVLAPGPFALIAGIIGVRDLKAHPEKGGMAGAVFGIVMGSLATVVIVVSIIASSMGH